MIRARHRDQVLGLAGCRGQELPRGPGRPVGVLVRGDQQERAAQAPDKWTTMVAGRRMDSADSDTTPRTLGVMRAPAISETFAPSEAPISTRRVAPDARSRLARPVSSPGGWLPP
jgi:hypothetical protein